jgi:hypothetical protein
LLRNRKGKETEVRLGEKGKEISKSCLSQVVKLERKIRKTWLGNHGKVENQF